MNCFFTLREAGRIFLLLQVNGVSVRLGDDFAFLTGVRFTLERDVAEAQKEGKKCAVACSCGYRFAKFLAKFFVTLSGPGMLSLPSSMI